MTLIWDWNGTLLDDVALCSELINEMLTMHGYAPVGGLDAYRSVFRFPIEAYYKAAGFDFVRHPFPQLAQVYMKLYTPRSEQCPLQPHAREVLTVLQGFGVRQIILSASPLPVLCEQVAQRGISDCFSTLLGLSDPLAKSKLALGQAWMEASGLNPAETMLVGDSVHDYEVAQALGARCVLYSGGHQPYEALAATGAPVIDDLRNLLSLLSDSKPL